MEFYSDGIIESSTLALNGLSERNRLIAANIANNNTPGYKRVDLKFEDQLASIMRNEHEKQQSKQEFSQALMQVPNTLLHANFGDESALNTQNSKFIPIGNSDTNYGSFQPEVTNNDYVSEKQDGNNVNIEYEMAELAKNGTKYAAVSNLLNKRIMLMTDMIKAGGV